MEHLSKPDLKRIGIGLLVGAFALSFGAYLGYYFGQNQACLQEEADIQTKTGFNQNPPTAPLRFTASADTPWKEHEGLVYNYTLSYPETLPIVVFPNDPSDAVALEWGNIPAENNILLNVEDINNQAPEYVGNVQGFVENWWRFFSGLKGVASVDKFTNTQGLTGYKAIYINTSDQSPNVDVFFEIPGNPSKVIHMANGVLDPVIFNRMVDNINYEEPEEDIQSTPSSQQNF
jgi:hypothetical protein